MSRWKQRFENFEKSYKLLEKYTTRNIENELERAGVIQFFEMTMELSWKVLKDYFAQEELVVNSPRETIKLAFQQGLIEDGHVFLEALSARNLTSHTYDDKLSNQMIEDIKEVYLPELNKLYEKLLEL